MLRAVFRLVVLVCALNAVSALAQEQRVVKVLPHLLDKGGRHTQSPSLFARDAYQAWLRTNPEEQSGIRYDIQWQSYISGQYTMKLELLGKVYAGQTNKRTIEVELDITNRRRQWQSIEFTGEAFKEFGDIVAWRVSIWQGGEMLSARQSFLWE